MLASAWLSRSRRCWWYCLRLMLMLHMANVGGNKSNTVNDSWELSVKLIAPGLLHKRNGEGYLQHLMTTHESKNDVYVLINKTSHDVQRNTRPGLHCKVFETLKINFYLFLFLQTCLHACVPAHAHDSSLSGWYTTLDCKMTRTSSIFLLLFSLPQYIFTLLCFWCVHHYRDA